MPAPTLVSYQEVTSFTAVGTPKSVASVAVQAGDLIVVTAIVEDSAYTFGTPSDGTNTYTSRVNASATSWCRVQMWTATAAGNATLTISNTLSNATKEWGFGVSVWRNHNSFGNTGTQTTGDPANCSITTAAANSAILWAAGDWNAVDGSSASYRQVNSASPTQRHYARNASTYTSYIYSHADAGTAAAKAVGWTSPTGTRPTVAAIEIKGAAGTTVNGTATLPVTFSSPVLGRPTKVGATAQAFGPTTPALGRPTKVGASVTAIAFTSAVSAVPKVFGVATGSFGFTAPAAGARRTTGAITTALGFTAPAVSTQGTLRRDLHKDIGHAPASISDYVTAFSPNTASGGYHRGDGGESVLGPTWQLFCINDFFISNGSGGVNAFPVNNAILEVESDGKVYWLNGGNGGAAGTNAFPDITGSRVVWLKGGWVTSSTSAIIMSYVWSGGVLQGYQVMAITGIGTSTPKHSPVYPCGIPDEGINWGGTPYLHDGYVYLHGFHLTNSTAHVCRCALSSDPGAYRTWEVWTGSAWASSGAGTVTIGTGPFGYLSVVAANPDYSVLLASSKEFNTAPGLGIDEDVWSEIRGWSASAPEGPWTYLGVFYQPTTLTDWFSYSGRIERYLGVDRMVAVWSLNADEPTFDPDVYGLQLADARNQLSATAATGSFTFGSAASGAPVERATATLPVTFSGAASGRPTKLGAIVTAVTFSGAASGTVAGDVTGTATGVFGFTAPAMARPTKVGTSATSISFTAPASARPTVMGASATSITFAGPAQGLRTRPGTLIGAFGPATAATGRRDVLGASTAAFGPTAPATGRPVVLGTLTGAWSFTATASGSVAAAGTGSATLAVTFAAPALGRPTVVGVTAVALGPTTAAAGTSITLGSATLPATFSAPASGAGAKAGAATLVLTVGTATAGRVEHRASATLAVAVTFVALGRRGVSGASLRAIAFSGSASGSAYVPAAGLGGLVEGPDMVGAGAILSGSSALIGGIT